MIEQSAASANAAAVVVIGGGPAGLMAAEVIARHDLVVHVYDAMPSLARKFLRAGVGGMNITHAEAFAPFVARYRERAAVLEPLLREFGADQLRAWIHDLGIETFVGSSGRVFPTAMKAAPLLRAWLHRLRQLGVRFHTRHRFRGFADDGGLRIEHAGHELRVPAAAVVLATGGASWPQLGSDGDTVGLLERLGVPVRALCAANGGFDVNWSAFMREQFAGSPLKSIAMACVDVDGRRVMQQGEAVITRHGIEGGLVYALAAPLREQLRQQGTARLEIDLLPQRTLDFVRQQLAAPRGAQSRANVLRKRLGLYGAKAALLRECTDQSVFADANALAQAIKALPLTLTGVRPLAEAISSAGGVCFEALDCNLMLTRLPGVFCAGEMLDWEAPTGGYLLTACFATGVACGHGVVRWLRRDTAM